MQSNKKRTMRMLALVLILALVTPTLLACSVVDQDPVILKVGDVTIRYSQFVSVCNSNYQSYNAQTPIKDTQGLMKFQDDMFDLLKQYAMLLYQAHKQNLTLTDEEAAEIEESVAEEMDALTENFVSEVPNDDKMPVGKLESSGYGLTDDDQEEVDAKLDELLENDLKEYRQNVDSSITGTDAKNEAAKELLMEKLEGEGKSYDDYLAEKTEEARYEVMWHKYAKVEAVPLRDAYIKDNLKMSPADYEQELRDSYTDNKLVEKMEQIVRDEKTLNDGEAREWYDEQVKTLTEKYEKDDTGYFYEQQAYDSRAEDSIVVRPLVIPEGYIRVKHILLMNPEETATTAPAADESEAPTTEDPANTDETTADPETTEPETTEPTTTEAVDATPTVEPTTEAPATEEAAETTEAVTDEPADETADPDATVKPEVTTAVAQELIDEVQASIDAMDPNADKLAAFDQLIEKYNEDPGMDTEPYSEIGYLVSESMEEYYYDGFAAAALALENVGDISGPVITEVGVHFIQLVEVVEAKTVTFEEAQEEIEEYVLNLEQTKYVETVMEEWAETLPVTEWRTRIRSYQPSTLGSSSISLG